MRLVLKSASLVLLIAPTGCKWLGISRDSFNSPAPTATPNPTQSSGNSGGNGVVSYGLSGSPEIPSDIGTPQLPPEGTVRVLVEDSGFDVSHEVFKNKVIGNYTVVCQGAQGNQPLNPPTRITTREQLKTAIIESLKKSDESCQIKPELKFVSSVNFPTIRKYREKWNTALKSKRKVEIFSSESELDGFLKILDGKDGKFIYHGTATAGLIAYQNPKVQLFLLQRDSLKSDEEEKKTFSLASDCPTQGVVDELVALFNDPDVFKAAVEEPLSREEKQYYALLNSQGIQIVNMSFGTMPTRVIEQKYKEEGCGSLDLSGYSQTLSKIRAERAKAGNHFSKWSPNSLFVRAAGNENSRVDNGGDFMECPFPEEKGIILVGSHNEKAQVSDFSNHGKCVGAYTLGDGVVVAAPDHFLNIKWGTSFSAPLLVRYLSQNTTRTDDSTALLKRITDNRDPTTLFMKFHTFPKELAFVLPQQIPNYALTDDTSRPFSEDDGKFLRRFKRDLGLLRQLKR